MARVAKKKAVKSRKKPVKAKKKAVRKPSNGKSSVAKKRKAADKKRRAADKKSKRGKGITIVRQTSVARKTEKPGKTNGKPLSQKQFLSEALGMAQAGLDGFDAGDLRAARRNLRFLVDFLSAK